MREMPCDGKRPRPTGGNTKTPLKVKRNEPKVSLFPLLSVLPEVSKLSDHTSQSPFGSGEWMDEQDMTGVRVKSMANWPCQRTPPTKRGSFMVNALHLHLHLSLSLFFFPSLMGRWPFIRQGAGTAECIDYSSWGPCYSSCAGIHV
jgi:hypothetical protein